VHALTGRFSGIFTPLITPLTEHEDLDLASMTRLVTFQIDSGVAGLWVMGTTSEFASFSETERASALECVVRAADGRVPVVANISDASTRLAVRHARQAASLGADAIAATPPYYYPHSQDEVLSHFRGIRDVVELPLLIYNIPQTVRVRVELPTARTLAAEGTVVGIKDSQNDLEWFRQLAVFTRREGIDFALFAGTRYLIDAAVLAGATGAIPSIANAFPDLCVSIFASALRSELDAAARMEEHIIEIESISGLAAAGSRNAAVISFLKHVLHRRGVIDSPVVTMPLRALTEDEAARALKQLDAVTAAVG
jgi:4-hydroxy-tetrahydrodipicolinate synthase